MGFKSDKQRKKVMALLRGGTKSAVNPQVIGSQTGFREKRKIAEQERQERFKPKNIKTVVDVMSLNIERKQFFFSPDTLKFFSSRILGGQLQGRNKDLFITSEKQPSSRGEDFSRMFTIRKVNKNTGGIVTVGEFQQFGTQTKAKKFIIDKNL